MAEAPASGTRVGPWLLIEELGHGGMGSVWRATREDDAVAAVKLLHPHLARSDAQLRRFRREAELGTRLTHPNLVPTLDSGEVDGLPWMAMELIAGPTLFELAVDEAPLDEMRVRNLLAEVADALAELHDHGIVHRDVKPQNLVYDRAADRARLMDLGIARAAEYSTLTATGQFIGSTRYAAPEQFHPGATPVDGRADLYALGVVLYELLTGQMAFPGLGVPALYVAKVRNGVPDPSVLRPDLSPIADALVRALTATDPDRRPEDARAAAHALRTGHIDEFEEDSSVITLVGWDELPPSNAPEPTEAAIGRSGQAHGIAEQLREGALLTLTGTAGSGKTRLALELARMTRPRWLGGVVWVEAERSTTVDELSVVLGAALGLPALGNPVEQIGHALRAREASLVILDNIEQIEGFAPTLGAWIEAGDQRVAWLTTSRVPTGVAAEVLVEVDPLDLPPVGATDVSAVRESPAVELFLRRARDADRRFALTPENAADVAQLVRRLDGLPLALELAASRVAVVSPRRMLERLDRRFRLLRDRGATGKHAALQAALDASWELLEPWEQAAFAWSGVFAGAFDADDAEAVWPIWEQFPDGDDPLDILQSLLAHHLLKREATAGEVRFSQLQSIREYARERLADPSSVEGDEGPATGPEVQRELARRLAAHLAERSADELVAWKRDSDPLALDRMAARVDDLLLAAEADHEGAGLCAEAALTVIARRGPIAAVARVAEALSSRQPHDGALQALGQAQLLASRLDEADATFSKLVDRPGYVGVTALSARGLVRLQRGQPDAGEADLQEALMRTESTRSPDLLRARARALNHYGKLCIGTGRPGLAGQVLDEAIGLLEHASPLLASAVHNNRGMLCLRTGKIPEAERSFSEALRIDRDMGTRLGEGKVLTNLGIVAYHQGRPERAEALWTEALACHREVGNAESEAVALGNLGQLAMERGRIDDARRHVAASLALKETLGQPVAVAYGTVTLAKIELADRNYAQCIGLCESVLALLQERHDKRVAAEALLVISEARVGQGERDAALTDLDSACHTALEGGFTAVAAAAAARRTELLAGAGRLEEARESLTLAETHTGEGPERALLLIARGSVALASGDTEGAGRALRLAEDVTTTLGMGPEAAGPQGVERLKLAIAASEAG